MSEEKKANDDAAKFSVLMATFVKAGHHARTAVLHEAVQKLQPQCGEKVALEMLDELWHLAWTGSAFCALEYARVCPDAAAEVEQDLRDTILARMTAEFVSCAGQSEQTGQ